MYKFHRTNPVAEYCFSNHLQGSFGAALTPGVARGYYNQTSLGYGELLFGIPNNHPSFRERGIRG